MIPASQVWGIIAAIIVVIAGSCSFGLWSGKSMSEAKHQPQIHELQRELTEADSSIATNKIEIAKLKSDLEKSRSGSEEIVEELHKYQSRIPGFMARYEFFVLLAHYCLGREEVNYIDEQEKATREKQLIKVLASWYQNRNDPDFINTYGIRFVRFGSNATIEFPETTIRLPRYLKEKVLATIP